jgi:hypothetical protein
MSNAAEIEARAEEVLANVPDWLWNGEEVPVPVDDIADTCFGLLIREVEEMSWAPGAPELAPGQTLSGLLLAGPGEIWVNAAEAKEWPGRRRFTIGHELGHWVMHREPGQQSLFCRKAAVDPDAADDDDSLSIEDEANIFAAALTMPGRLIRERYAQLKGEKDCHARMCELFAASGAAMGRRLHTAI